MNRTVALIVVVILGILLGWAFLAFAWGRGSGSGGYGGYRGGYGGWSAPAIRSGYGYGWRRYYNPNNAMGPTPTPLCSPGKLEDIFPTTRIYYVDGADLGKPGEVCYMGVPPQ